MDVRNKAIIVTGGASGIGRALCEGFAHAGARAIGVADLDGAAAMSVARGIGAAACAYACDVTDPAQIAAMIDDFEDRTGGTDLFCSNAGIASGYDMSFSNAAGAATAVWDRAIGVNLMAHVHAARVLVPRMRQRGGGYFLHTVSAAGLLSQIGSAVYSATKHAAIGFAENLAITHRADGIRVSVLCPQGVDTPLLRDLPQGPQAGDGVLSPADVAQAALAGIAAERFLILPHGQVAGYMRNKIADYDRWIAGMARLQARIADASADAQGDPRLDR